MQKDAIAKVYCGTLTEEKWEDAVKNIESEKSIICARTGKNEMCCTVPGLSDSKTLKKYILLAAGENAPYLVIYQSIMC